MIFDTSSRVEKLNSEKSNGINWYVLDNSKMNFIFFL